jgi:hypothetical protein
MKSRIFLLVSLLATGLAAFFYLKISGFEQQMESETVKIRSISDSLHYYKIRAKADSLFIAGEIELSVSYYQQADSIAGRSELAEDKKQKAEKLKMKQDSLEKLKMVMFAIQKDFEQVKISKNKEVNYKDSLLEEYNDKVNYLTNQVEELKDGLAKAKGKISQMANSTGRLEFETSNGSKVMYAGDVASGKANGSGFGLFSTGGVYNGEWKNNKRHGKGKYTWKDGNIYEGDFADDKRHGTGTYYFVSGEKYVGEWKNNKRSGKGIHYGKDGKEIYNGLWENDETVKKAE